MTPGVHFVRITTRAGSARWYIYAWRGGPRVATVDGGGKPRLSRELAARIAQLRAEAADRGAETIRGLIRDWRRSPEWQRLADNTRATWSTPLARIEDRWGETPLDLWNDPRMVGKVVAWRDSMRDRPRAADIGVTVLSRLLEWGRLRARVRVNVAAGVPGLYRGQNRAAIVWTDADLDAFCRSALMLDRPLLTDALFLAAWSGLRLADLAALTFAEVGEHAIVRTALKKSRGRRRRAVVPVLPQLALLLEDLRGRPRHAGVETVLVNSFGRPWSAESLGKRFAEVRDHAGIREPADPREGAPERAKHLHDLRGTFVTALCRAGLTDDEISNIVAWSPANVAAIRKTYVDDAQVVVALSRRIRDAL
jgi:hypothetical protein